MKGDQEYVTWARSKRGLRCAADRSVLHAGSLVSSQHQEVRFLPSQFFLDESQRIAVLDRHHRSALAQSQSLDEPGQRLLGLLLHLGWRPLLLSLGSNIKEAVAM